MLVVAPHQINKSVNTIFMMILHIASQIKGNANVPFLLVRIHVIMNRLDVVLYKVLANR